MPRYSEALNETLLTAMNDAAGKALVQAIHDRKTIDELFAPSPQEPVNPPKTHDLEFDIEGSAGCVCGYIHTGADRAGNLMAVKYHIKYAISAEYGKTPALVAVEVIIRTNGTPGPVQRFTNIPYAAVMEAVQHLNDHAEGVGA